MRVSNITTEQLITALNNINDKRKYQLTFNRSPEFIGRWLHFTIKSIKSGIPGARTSWSGRNLPAASWHAHGYLFDEILLLAPNAVIKTAQSTVYIEANKIIGNWVDSNIGSMVSPCQYSETSIL